MRNNRSGSYPLLTGETWTIHLMKIVSMNPHHHLKGSDDFYAPWTEEVHIKRCEQQGPTAGTGSSTQYSVTAYVGKESDSAEHSWITLLYT